MSDTQTNLELEHTEKLQIVVVVRYKPSANAMDAGAMLDGVSSGIKSATDTVDSALSYVPGVFEEQKNKEQALDTDYNYYESYPKHWDKVLKETKDTLKEMNEKNEYILFEYDSTDKLDTHISMLETQVKAAISPLKNEIYAIHFVGIAQGGNIAAAVASKIKSSLAEHGRIESILCVGTALYGDNSVIKSLNSTPNVANFKSSYDLSSNGILYSKNPDKLLATIKQVNQTPIKYMYNMLMVKITKLLSQLLNGITMGTTNGIAPLKNLIETLKSDIKSIIEDLLKFTKHIFEAFKAFLVMPDIDQKFDQILGNSGQVALASKDRLLQFTKIVEDVFIKGVSKANLDFADLPIEKLFNFLTPPVLLIDNLLNALTINLVENKSANQLKEFTGKDAFYAPITNFDKSIASKDPYHNVVIEAAKNKSFDQVSALVYTTKQDIESLSIEDIEEAKREEIGLDLSQKLMLPMLSSKTELLGMLLKKLPSLGDNVIISKIKPDTVTAPLINLLQKLRANFDFDNTDTGNDNELGLKKALARVNTSIGKIKAILKPNYFKVNKQYNSLHFIYNSHNISLVEMPKELRKTLDQATKIYAYKLSKGFEYNELDGSYKPGKDGTKTEDLLVVAEKESKD